jgi:hypothetical protein
LLDEAESLGDYQRAAVDHRGDAEEGGAGNMMDCIKFEATLAIVLWADAMTRTLTT